MARPVAILVALLAFLPAAAQGSASFKVGEHVLIAAGHPDDGTIPTSASYRITTGGVGENAEGTRLESPSYRLDEGFVGGSPPPGDVTQLRFPDRSTLTWQPEPSAGTYNIYRNLMTSLPGLGYGVCFAAGLDDSTGANGGTPPAHDGWFYLVTVANRLDEEGTKGYRSNGDERANAAPCP